MITVIGAGAWGSNLAAMALANGYNVNMWSRRSNLSLTGAIKDSKVIVSAISMQGVRDVIEQLQGLTLSPQTIFVSATKGLDPQTARTPCQIWQDTFPSNPIVVLSGPNLSKEIEKGLPAATVVASNTAIAASKVQLIFSSNHFRVYTNLDPLGVELGGTLKNVVAIAAGVCDGLQLGTNAKAALVTRGLTEMVRIGVHWGAQQETFYGLSGLGDLIATCNSPFSRNYQVGYQLAGGRDLQEILANLQGAAEGINTTTVLKQCSQRGDISMPITEQVYCLLQAQVTPKEALEGLMLRDIKPEYQQ